MLSHVMVGTRDIERSRAFYDVVLGVLGVGEPFVNVNATGQTRLFYRHKGTTFSISEPIDGEAPTVANGSTIGFVCSSPEQVKELHDVAVANGATSIEEPPGPRENPIGTMYLCYFRDPDGHKLCGIHRPG
ncbi:MAG: VOC family protein [Pseudomonadota bacterium]